VRGGSAGATPKLDFIQEWVKSFTMPSRTLAPVGMRDIGLRSFWVEVGGWILGIGIATTCGNSADFQI